MSKRETPDQIRRKMERLQDDYESFCDHPFLRALHEHIADLRAGAERSLAVATGEDVFRTQGELRAMESILYAHITAYRVKMAECRFKLDILERELEADRAETGTEAGNTNQPAFGLGSSDSDSPL